MGFCMGLRSSVVVVRGKMTVGGMGKGKSYYVFFFFLLVRWRPGVA